MTTKTDASHAALTGVCDYAKEAHADLLKQAEEVLAAIPKDDENRWRVELLVMNLRIHKEVFAERTAETEWRKNAK